MNLKLFYDTETTGLPDYSAMADVLACRDVYFAILEQNRKDAA